MERLPIPTVDSPLIFAAPATVKYQRKGGRLETVLGVEKIEVSENGSLILFMRNNGIVEVSDHMVLSENVAELWRATGG